MAERSKNGRETMLITFFRRETKRRNKKGTCLKEYGWKMD